ncbi:MAG: hypothetical protein MZV70_48585 [Desulfobacterales bacterium]|nr:hypothetical protein [Desulfobacterales bacterium]
MLDPYTALGRLLALFHPEDEEPAGISERATIEAGADVSPEAAVYPGVHVCRGARVEKRAVLYPGVFIGRDAAVGEDSILYPGVTVYRRCRIGRRVVLHAGVVVGSDGFGFALPGRETGRSPRSDSSRSTTTWRSGRTRPSTAAPSAGHGSSEGSRSTTSSRSPTTW